MNTLEDVRSHIGPRIGVFLGKHEWQKIYFTKSPLANDTVVARSIILHFVATGTDRKSTMMGINYYEQPTRNA